MEIELLFTLPLTNATGEGDSGEVSSSSTIINGPPESSSACKAGEGLRTGAIVPGKGLSGLVNNSPSTGGEEIEVGVGLGHGLEIGIAIGFGLDIGLEYGLEIGLEMALEIGFRLGLGFGLVLGLVLGLGTGIEIGLGHGLRLGLGLGLELGHGLGHGLGQGLGHGLRSASVGTKKGVGNTLSLRRSVVGGAAFTQCPNPDHTQGETHILNMC